MKTKTQNMVVLFTFLAALGFILYPVFQGESSITNDELLAKPSTSLPGGGSLSKESAVSGGDPAVEKN